MGMGPPVRVERWAGGQAAEGRVVPGAHTNTIMQGRKKFVTSWSWELK